MRTWRGIRVFAVVALTALVLAGRGRAQQLGVGDLTPRPAPSWTGEPYGIPRGSPESCGYKGKTIEFAVPDNPGDPFDTYARLLAPYLEKKLHARVVVVNESGAGGLESLNRHQSTDKPHLVLVDGVTALAAQIGGHKKAHYDLMTRPWIGRVVEEHRVILTSPKGRYRSWAEVVDATEPVEFGATRPGAADFIVGTVVKAALDAPLTLTSGYQDTSRVTAALRRGEVDIAEAPTRVALPLMKAGKVRPLTVIARETPRGTTELPDVVTDYEELSHGEALQLSGLVYMTEVGGSVATTPGTRPGCLLLLTFKLSSAIVAIIRRTMRGEDLPQVDLTVSHCCAYNRAVESSLEYTLKDIYSTPRKPAGTSKVSERLRGPAKNECRARR